MKIENQVCSLEQSKRLESLGVTVPSIMYHHFGSGMKWQVLPDGFFYKEEEGVEFYAAFTVAELGVMLPFKFPYEGEESVVTTTPFDQKDYLKAWIAGIMWVAKPNIRYATPRKYISAPTEAQARAAMLIYLLENNHITPDEVNQRLQSA